MFHVNPLSANPTKWSNTLKKFVGKLPTNCLSLFDHFVNLALKGLSMSKLTFKLPFKMFEKLQFLIVLINIMDALNIDLTTDLLLTRKVLYIFF